MFFATENRIEIRFPENPMLDQMGRRKRV